MTAGTGASCTTTHLKTLEITLAPLQAAYVAVQPTMAGTPGAGNTLFMSNVQAVLAPEGVPALASTATINFAPGSFFPPVGVTQLN